MPGNMVNNNPAGKTIPFIPGRIFQRTVTYSQAHDLERLNFDIWDLSQAPINRVRRRVAGVDARGNPSIALNTPAAVDFDQNIRLCPVLNVAQMDLVIRSRNVVVLQNKYRNALGDGNNVTIVNLRVQGIIMRLPGFIIQLGSF